MLGEKIYEYDIDITEVTDFGVSLDDILSGKAGIPVQGARVDIAFAGQATGRVTGSMNGIDHVRVRADGRVDLCIRAIMETGDGHRIAFAADGVLLRRPEGPVADLRENVELTTASEDYAWVNKRQIWGVGTVNFANGKAHVEGYMQ